MSAKRWDAPDPMFEIQSRLRRGEFDLNVDIRAPSTGVLALFGRSGSGKTTLVQVVAGLLKSEQSKIVIDESVLEDTQRHHFSSPEHRRIGYVFQDARLFPHLSVARNLQFGMRRSRATPPANLWDQVVALLGLQNLLDRRSQQLSGGERQRVALGRALLMQPRLLIMDEPLASIDAARRNEVLPYLERLRDEFAMPIIYVSHDFDEVLRLADHVVLLDQGRVVAQGDIGSMSLQPQLRQIVGSDAVGAVLNGEVESVSSGGLAVVRVGRARLSVNKPQVQTGTRVRVQLLARDLILAIEPPRGLSVRNVIEGRVVDVSRDDDETDLVRVDIGNAAVMARLTRAASVELKLSPGLPIWVLVKAVSMRAHMFASPDSSKK
jgi:molybdate transport system ATP-binding protein